MSIEYLVNQLIRSHGICSFVNWQVKLKAVLAVPATFEAIIYQSNETSRNNGASRISQRTFIGRI
jgi:hypothetical protein